MIAKFEASSYDWKFPCDLTLLLSVQGRCMGACTTIPALH